MSASNSPHKIAFCITELDPGGAERALVEIACRLPREHWIPHVFSLSERGDLVDRLDAGGIDTTCFGFKHVWQFPQLVRRLTRELKRLRPALLQTFLYHANIVGRLAGRLAGIDRIVCGIRVAERRSRIPLLVDRYTQRFVDHNVCVSQAVAEFTNEQAGIPIEKLSVIPNGVDFHRFASATPADLHQFGIPSSAVTVALIGRLVPQKDPMTFLEAAIRLIPHHPDLYILVVGEGALRADLESRANQVGLSNRIRFAGWQQDIPGILKAIDCLAMSSLWEGMPNVILEAMAAGCPVVTTRVEGTSELITPGETGWLAPCGAVNAFADVLNHVLASAEVRTRVGKASQTVVDKQFTISASAAAYNSLYCRLLDRH